MPGSSTITTTVRDVRGRTAAGLIPRRPGRVVLLLAGAAFAVWATSRLSTLGVSWSQAWQLATHLGWWWPTALAAVWLLGLWVHTVVLTASLPGLSHRQALTLNLSGSAVSNVLPLGGVAGTVLNLSMTRRWGHGPLAFARFIVVSKAWDLAAKLVMPLIAAVLLCDVDFAAHHLAWLLGAAFTAAAGVLVVAALLGSSGPLLRVVALVEQVWGGLLRRARRAPHTAWRATVADLLTGTDQLVRRRWAALTWGMAAYWALQAALLWLCLLAVGLQLSPPVVFAGLVTERVLSLLAITPGGTGLVETGTVAVFIALGADPTGALAGVLLFRAFVFAAGIPVGGLVTAVWLAARHLPRVRLRSAA